MCTSVCLREIERGRQTDRNRRERQTGRHTETERDGERERTEKLFSTVFGTLFTLT